MEKENYKFKLANYQFRAECESHIFSRAALKGTIASGTAGTTVEDRTRTWEKVATLQRRLICTYASSYGKSRIVIGKEWGPETWNKDTWDAYEIIELPMPLIPWAWKCDSNHLAGKLQLPLIEDCTELSTETNALQNCTCLSLKMSQFLSCYLLDQHDCIGKVLPLLREERNYALRDIQTLANRCWKELKEYTWKWILKVLDWKR